MWFAGHGGREVVRVCGGVPPCPGDRDGLSTAKIGILRVLVVLPAHRPDRLGRRLCALASLPWYWRMHTSQHALLYNFILREVESSRVEFESS